jgi:hypothetical protein
MFEQNQNEREILFVRWAISACRFTSYIHPNILDGIFPLQDGDLVVKEVSIDTISRTMSREEACQLFLSKGCRAATFVELLHWWLLHPTQKIDYLVVALGSEWCGNVPHVDARNGYRGLGLSGLGGDCMVSWRFAVVRTTP